MLIRPTRIRVVVPIVIAISALAGAVPSITACLEKRIGRSDVPGMSIDSQPENRTPEHWDDERLTNTARLELNAQIMMEFVYARLSLAETVDLKLQVNHTHGPTWDYLRVRYPDAANDRERMICSVVNWVESLATEDPSRADEVLTRIRPELLEMTGGRIDVDLTLLSRRSSGPGRYLN